MKKSIIYILTLLLLTAQSGFGLSLDEAKSRGLVGETPSGYLDAVDHKPEVILLIHEINTKRRAEYQSIAQKNGTPLQAVEQLAGKKAIERTAPGNFVKVDGQWRKK
jgi:uncharacterized protein